MITRADFLAEARTWEGTPYRHQGRIKGDGADCFTWFVVCLANLGSAAAKAILADREMMSYRRDFDRLQLLRGCQKHLRPKPVDQLRPADLLLVRFDIKLQHLAVWDEGPSVIHADGSIKPPRVVKHGVPAAWLAHKPLAFEIPVLS